MTRANPQVRYWKPDGSPTTQGELLIRELSDRADTLESTTAAQAVSIAAQAVDLAAQELRIAALETQMAAIAAVVAPTGGATIDAEARTAIADILAAAT